MFYKTTQTLVLLLTLIASLPAHSESQATLEAFKQEYASYQQLSEAGDWENSLLHAKRAYEMGKELFEKTSKNLSALTYNYGLNFLELQRFDEATPILREALEQYETVYGKNSNELIPVLMDLGHAVSGSSQSASGSRYFDRALALTAQHYGADSIDYAQRLGDAGNALLLKAGSEQAKNYLYQSYELLKKLLGDSAPRTGYAAFNIGKYELAVDHYETAIRFLDEALQSFSTEGDEPSRLELTTHGFLALAYEKLEQRDKATSHCIAIGKATPAPPPENYRPLFVAAPIYPESSGDQQEGYVILAYDVDTKGFVRNPEVVEIKGPHSFADASLQALKKFRYAPRFVDGKAVITRGVKHRFAFAL